MEMVASKQNKMNSLINSGKKAKPVIIEFVKGLLLGGNISFNQHGERKFTRITKIRENLFMQERPYQNHPSDPGSYWNQEGVINEKELISLLKDSGNISTGAWKTPSFSVEWKIKDAIYEGWIKS